MTKPLHGVLLAIFQTSLIAQSFTVSTVFPLSKPGGSILNSPSGTILDGSGNMYISDTFGNVVVRRTPDGVLQPVAGTGTGGFTGDGGLATAAQVNGPAGLAIDSSGNLLIADSFNQRIRKVTPAGIITTVAGNGSGGLIAPGQVATLSAIGGVASIVADASGNFYLPTTNEVVKVAPNGILSVLTRSAPGLVQIWPYSLALDNAGGIIVGMQNGIFRLNANGTMATIATFTSGGFYVAWNPSRGTCYGSSSQIKCIDGTGNASVLAGTGDVGLGGDGGAATSAILGFVAGITFDSSGNLYICDGNKRVRIVDASGIINTFWKSDALPAPVFPKYVATDAAGNLYISDEGANVVFRVTPAGVTSVVAGTGARGVGGDGVAATDSSLFAPSGIHVDTLGNLYIAEDGTHRVRKVDSAGIIHTIAGTGVPGFSGDGGPGQAAMLNTPLDLTTDSAGNVYIADTYNNRVRRVAPDGVITTVAGSGPGTTFASSGSSGDGGPAIAAQLNGPMWLAISPAGDIYVSDSGTIRKFRPGGNITTILGTGACGIQGDGGLATLADLCGGGFVADSSGNLFVSGYTQVHMLDSTGHLINIAGSLASGFAGDGGPALNALFNNIWGLAVDRAGSVFIADFSNLRIRKVTGGQRCSIVLSPTAIATDAGASSGNLTMTSGPACSYTAAADVPWIHVSGNASGTGSASIAYTVDLNASPGARTGSIQVSSAGGGASLFINQSGMGCAFSIAPPVTTTDYYQYSGGALLSQTPPRCLAGTASSDSAWLRLTSPAIFAAAPGVAYTAENNSTSATRTAVVTVGSQTHTLIQGAGPVGLVSPTPGSTLDCRATFQWSNLGATNFAYQLGTSPGLADLGSGQTTATSVTLQNLPSGGKPLYFRLWFADGVIWHSTPIAATFIGSCSAKPGVFRSGFYWLLDVDGNRQFDSPPDRAFAFGGVAGDIPITGDWNGSGTSKAGIYRPSNGLFILDTNGNGVFDGGDAVYNLGVGTQAGDVPVVGDWNGDGKTKVGLFRQGFFWILDTNGNGVFEQGVDNTYAFGGVAGDVPVVGDWTGPGTSKIGLFRLGFYWILDANGNGVLDNINSAGGDQAFAYGGIAGDVPVVGDWNGGGTSKVGVFRQGFFWVLDANGNHTFDGTGGGQDLAFPFGGIGGDLPVMGKW